MEKRLRHGSFQVAINMIVSSPTMPFFSTELDNFIIVLGQPAALVPRILLRPQFYHFRDKRHEQRECPFSPKSF